MNAPNAAPVQMNFALDSEATDWRDGLTVIGCVTCGALERMCDECEAELTEAVSQG
jgi:hypothetical protein